MIQDSGSKHDRGFHSPISPFRSQSRAADLSVANRPEDRRDVSGGVQEQIEPPARSVMIESPTGSGKSVMGLLVAKLLQSMTGAKVGWVAMRRNLLERLRHLEIEADSQHRFYLVYRRPFENPFLIAKMSISVDDVFVSGQFTQATWAASMKLVGANAYLSP